MFNRVLFFSSVINNIYTYYFNAYPYFSVRPNRIELSGVGEHVIQGNRVVLQCVVRGARPAANVTWYNGTVQLQESSSAESLQVYIYFSKFLA